MDNQPRSAMSQTSLENKKSMRSLLFRKYLLQTFVVLIVFGTILFAAWNCLISREVTGTLIGTAIGSSLNFAYKSNNNTADRTDHEKKG